MSELAHHRVALTLYDSEVLAWVLDLPGCLAGGAGRAAAEAGVPLAIAEYGAWLREHGEEPGGEAFDVVEIVDAGMFIPMGGEFCFEGERAPISDDEMARCVALMGYAREDLLRAVASLPDLLLDWEPPREAIDHFDNWAPEARTIRGIFEHVLQLEAYYRDGLRDGPGAGIFGRVGDAAAERTATLERLHALEEDERARVFRPLRPGRDVADEWTVRKFFRRVISHERGHTAEIVQRRLWAQYGVPRPRRD